MEIGSFHDVEVNASPPDKYHPVKPLLKGRDIFIQAVGSPTGKGFPRASSLNLRIHVQNCNCKIPLPAGATVQEDSWPD